MRFSNWDTSKYRDGLNGRHSVQKRRLQPRDGLAPGSWVNSARHLLHRARPASYFTCVVASKGYPPT